MRGIKPALYAAPYIVYVLPLFVLPNANKHVFIPY